MHGLMRSALLLLALVCTIAPGLEARQDFTVAPQGPRFLLESAGAAEPVRVEPSRVPMLLQRVTVRLEDARLDEALQAISARTGIRLVYSGEVVPLDRPVSLKVEEISVAAALTEVLLGANVDVVISRNTVALVRRAPDLLPGTITGTVTEAETGNPVQNAQIAVDGRGRTLTNADGAYRIDGVEAGRRTVSVTSIGYASASHDVEVGDGATITVDFALEVSASQLDQIVVTVTGEQRVRELGHDVGQINADSLVREAPVSNITELLTGRIPGVQVFQASGTVGGDVQLQIRTPGSFLLSTQPIVVVDGVRYTSAPALDFIRQVNGNNIFQQGSMSSGAFPTSANKVEATSPLNDLNPNDIESIEVAKGPTAATLYGTDAANGVIVITTKKGRAGPARWNAFVRGGFNETPDIAPPSEMYWAFGTSPSGFPYSANCSLWTEARGSCAQDSIVAFTNPLEDPSRTIFASAPQWQSGLNVSGGTPSLRYYVSGSWQRETGSLRMPQTLTDSIEEARGASLPEDQFRPNAFRNFNLRSNLTMAFGSKLDVQGNLGYVRRTNRTIAISNPFAGAGQSPNLDGFGFDPPDAVFNRTSTEQVDRFIFGGNATWRPLGWLQARASAGLDIGNGKRHSLERRDEARNPFTGRGGDGSVQNDRTEQRTVTGDLGLTASFRRGRVSSRTSLGAQYVQSLNDVQIAGGTDLVPGGESVSQAANRFSNQLYSETVTLGSYAEQTFGLNDRLFLTGALRVDGASNFGQKFEAAVYPKASVSWIVSEEPFLPRIPGLNELRLRYAFGVAGQQAFGWMARPTFESFTPFAGSSPAVIEGSTSAVVDVTALGNPNLRPERSREHEFGFDASGFDNRLQLGLTWYRRRVVDQIWFQTLPAGLGRVFQNLGLTTARGFEASLNGSILDSRYLSWDLSVHHSSTSTLLEDAGDTGLREGFPLGATFQQPIVGFEDMNGDGIIDPRIDIQRTDTAIFMGGGSVAPSTQSLSTVFGFFNRQLRLSATFSRSTGNLLRPRTQCTDDQCLPLLDPSTPVEEQFRAIVSQEALVPADYVRLGEAALAVSLPSELLERIGVRSAAFSLSARNLALWASFPNGDPGSLTLFGAGARGGSNIPQARSWTMRFDLGF